MSGWRARAHLGVRLDWLLRGNSAGHISPDLKGGITCIAMVVSGQAMATELEVVVDVGLNGQEASGMSR